MGNREDLLAGAKRCLYEKGYARTTVRDIASAAGVSMAAIGYHFGSKEALLNAALSQANEEWGQEIGRALATAPHDSGTTLERFEAAWDQVAASMDTHRQLWAATFDVIGQLPHVPQLREQLAEGLTQAREGLPGVFGVVDVEDDEKKAWAVGSFFQALLTGVVAQHLIDPGRAPTGEDMAYALRTILEGVAEPGTEATP